MSRCPSRAESPPGADMLISPRLTSRWGSFAKERRHSVTSISEMSTYCSACSATRVPQLPRPFLDTALHTRQRGSTYSLSAPGNLERGSSRASHEIISDPRGLRDDGFRLDVSLRVRPAATKPLQR